MTAAKQTVRLSPAPGIPKLIFRLEIFGNECDVFLTSDTMTISATSASAGSSKHTSNLWKQAYQGLSEHPERGPRLEKLKALLKRDLGKPHIKPRSNDGVHELLCLVEVKKRQVESKKSTEKIQAACSHMNKVKDVFGAAADVGGPYVAIPVAALFSVFAVRSTLAARPSTP